MWYVWTALLVSCALVVAEVAEVTTVPVATTRSPPRTLDRKADELAWRSLLLNPEGGNPNRRIITKSLFLTPLVCPKGPRLDGTACIQVVTVNKEENEHTLLQHLQSLLPSSQNNGDTVYDYGEEDEGPTLLSIPIGIDPQQDPSAQPQEPQPNYVNTDKQGDSTAAKIEAELELLKLQQAHAKLNNTHNGSNAMSHNVLHNFLTYSDKPKRDSPMFNSSEAESLNNPEEGQKEIVFGHVNVDPVMYDTENQNNQDLTSEAETEKNNDPTLDIVNAPHGENNETNINNSHTDSSIDTSNLKESVSKKNAEEAKLNPENDYSDIGEAIKLISRYAEVSTDDNFTKDDKVVPSTEDSILGTRTKLQYRRNKPKPSINSNDPKTSSSDVPVDNDGISRDEHQMKNVVYYRYPWPIEGSASAPSNYPFHHLQDYWPGRTRVGGVYNTMHENPRRHHHSYPHYYRPRNYQYVNYPDTHPGSQEAYPGLRRYPHKSVDHNTSPMRSHINNQDLYSLLGLRHWFSSEGATKR